MSTEFENPYVYKSIAFNVSHYILAFNFLGLENFSLVPDLFN